MNQDFRIIWPQNCYVTAEQLITWANDDVANGDTAFTAEVYTVQEAIAVLQDSGTVTFAKA